VRERKTNLEGLFQQHLARGHVDNNALPSPVDQMHFRSAVVERGAHRREKGRENGLTAQLRRRERGGARRNEGNYFAKCRFGRGARQRRLVQKQVEPRRVEHKLPVDFVLGRRRWKRQGHGFNFFA